MGRKRRKKGYTNYNHNEDTIGLVKPRLDYELDEYQREYVKTIHNTPVTFVDEASGTGKTTLAIYMGLELLRKGLVGKIVYLRYVDDRYLQNGYLTGDLQAKTDKLFRPLRDGLIECNVSEKEMAWLIENEQLELTTDTEWRGGNLKETFLIIDEAQNSKRVSDLRLMLTRLHDEGGRAVVIGHSGQQDNKSVQRIAGYTPFQVYQYHMSKKPFTKICKLMINYRGDISTWADSVDESIAELESGKFTF